MERQTCETQNLVTVKVVGVQIPSAAPQISMFDKCKVTLYTLRYDSPMGKIGT